MKRNQQQRVIAIVGIAAVLVAQPAWGEELENRESGTGTGENLSYSLSPTPNSQLPTLSDLDQPATTVGEWMEQIAQAAIVSITGVQLNRTDTGVEIVLETAEGQLVEPSTSMIGNALIADIPNATIAEEFSQANPIEGIALVSVTNRGENSVRVAITGLDAPPMAEVRTEAQGLILVVMAGTEATAGADEDAIQVVVTGEQEDGYAPDNATTATLTDTPLRDIPQSIQIVPRQVIEDQGVTRTADALRNVSGVTMEGGYGNYIDSFNIRGFTNFNSLRNGLSLPFGFTTPIPSNTIERIEVFKGPAGVLFGSIEPGGVVNFITERPLADPAYSADFTVGSFDLYYPEIDITGPLTSDERLLYRFNAAYQSAGSFVDFVEQDFLSISPAFTYRLTDRTTLDLSYDYIQNEGIHYDGFPNNSPGIFDAPIDRFLGEPDDNEYWAETHYANVTLTHQFNNELELRSNFQYRAARLENSIFRPRDLEADGRTVTRIYNANSSYEENYLLQTNLISRFNTGSIAHQLLLGFDYTRFYYNSEFLENDVPSIDLFEPEYGATVPTEFREDSEVQENYSSTYAVYLQDQITLLPNLKLLIGGRYDFIYSDSSFQTYQNATGEFTGDFSESESYDDGFSPRIGIVYQPIEPLSLYASYSQSFIPNGGQDANGNLFPPTRGTQYEIGTRAELFDGRLIANLAAYDITKTNILTTDPDDPNFSIAAGDVTSRGIEFDIGGEILPGWNIIASTFVNDAFVSEDNDLPEGDTLANAPHEGASLWTTYELQSGTLEGLGFGFGLFYIGDREVSLPNTFEIPSYVRADASIFYRRDNWRVGLNFKNLFSTEYYEPQGGWIRPGAPFTVLGTIAVEF